MKSSCVVFSLLLLSITECYSGDCSGLEYILQPPSSTLADCDPYSFNGAIHILLECTVRGIPEAFEIRWFRENSSGIMEDLGQGFPDFTSGHNQRTSRYHSTELFHQLYDSSFLGKYWCQVINTTADPHQPLMRSNVFTLLAPEDYTYSSIFCSGQTLLQAVNNVTCADLPVQLGRVMPPTQAQSNEKLTESYQSTVRQDIMLSRTLPEPTQSLMLHPHNIKVSGSSSRFMPLSTTSQSATTEVTSVPSSFATVITSVSFDGETRSPSTYLAAGLGGGFFLLIMVTASIFAVALITRMKRTGKHSVSTRHAHDIGVHPIQSPVYFEATDNLNTASVVIYDDPEVNTRDWKQGNKQPSTCSWTMHPSSDLQTVPNMEEAESVAPYNTTVTREVSTELSLHREGTLLATRGSSMEVSTTHSCLTLSDQPSGRRDLAPTSSQRILKEHTYANLCGKQPERREAVHPHYTGDYERAPDYAPPSIPITGGSQAVEHFSDYERDPNYHHSEGLGSTRHVGDYERDPFYQPLQPHKSKQPVVSHEYSALKDSTLDSPQEYTIPQPRIHQ